MRKNRILFLTVFTILFFCHHYTNAWSIETVEYEEPPTIHSEVVGIFAFEQLSTQHLLLTTKVEKHHFVHALKREGDCSKKDMMRICGNQYVEDNFEVVINGRKMILNQEDMVIEKDFVLLTYTIDLLSPKVEKIKVNSNYMFKYNNHAILKVRFDLDGEVRNFSIRDRKRTIIAKF